MAHRNGGWSLLLGAELSGAWLELRQQRMHVVAKSDDGSGAANAGYMPVIGNGILQVAGLPSQVPEQHGVPS